MESLGGREEAARGGACAAADDVRTASDAAGRGDARSGRDEPSRGGVHDAVGAPHGWRGATRGATATSATIGGEVAGGDGAAGDPVGDGAMGGGGITGTGSGLTGCAGASTAQRYWPQSAV